MVAELRPGADRHPDTEPKATKPDATEPDATEPDATEPDAGDAAEEVSPLQRLVRLARRWPRVVRERTTRRMWVGNGRAHIELRGAHLPDSDMYFRHLVDRLRATPGVDVADVNAVVGRVVVAFDGDETDPAAILDVIEAVEEAHGRHTEGFPHDRPEHPADVEPLRRQLIAVGADLAGVAVTTLRRALRLPGIPPDIAPILSLVDATPRIRHEVESRLGPAAADLTLALAGAAAQALSQGPLGLLVDAAQRAGQAAELAARRDAWLRREPELHERRGPSATAAVASAPRVRPLPPGPADRYADRAGIASLIASVATLALSGDARSAITVVADGAPKAALAGREAFASWLGVSLSRRGVVAMDSSALRHLDRVDTVVIDAGVLITGPYELLELTGPDGEPLGPAAARTARAHATRLLDPRRPGPRERAVWRIGPLAAVDAGRPAARQLGRRARRPGAVVLGLTRGDRLVAITSAAPQLDPLAEELIEAGRRIGRLAIAGVGSGLDRRFAVDATVAGGSHLATSLRALQQDGRVVALVAGKGDAALRTADCGIGVIADGHPVPWGAHLVCGPGLAHAVRILDAVTAARTVSRRGSLISLWGSGAGALLALAGPPRTATTRALLAVNTAAGAAVAAGGLASLRLARQADPVGRDRRDWHAMAAGDALDALDAPPGGLAQSQAQARLADQPVPARFDDVGLARATLDELANPLTPALATGAAMSAASGSVTDAALIASVVATNALLGGVQRVGAGRALRRLLRASATRARVQRDGVEAEVDADQVVPGDIVHFGAGDAVVGDCRILAAADLEMDESSLTGESQLVAKAADPVPATNVAERTSMLYEGTVVGAGRATAVVVATGGATEVGHSLHTSRAAAPEGGVRNRLRVLTKATVPVAFAAGAALIGTGLLRGRGIRESLGTGVGLAVAAVPEGLPLVATVAQLAAARRLSRHNVLVRNPATMEALGRVDVLCFDKTGTLTEGEVQLGRVSDGRDDTTVDRLDHTYRLVLAAGLRASPPGGGELPHPTDRAVVAAGRAAGVGSDEGRPGWRLVDEVPFESARGYHATLGATRAGQVLSVKGAPEVVLPLCRNWLRDGVGQPLDRAARAAIDAEIDRLAAQGYRLLAVAERAASTRAELDQTRVVRLDFLGLLAFADPVRPTSAQAIAGLRAAGVRVIMATGDHPSTAESIAAELGILADGRVVTGAELDRVDDRTLAEWLPTISVFARVTPTHKVRIVRALRQAGHTVAMTGDGANDAAAIRLADVGVALGDRGTDAAREAADLVVIDDGIESIIEAMVEGRAMWAAVRDAVSVLVGGNLGEIAFTLGTGLFSAAGSPLGARQLLLVNLLTDMLPSLALAVGVRARPDPADLLEEGPDASLGSALTREVGVRAAATAASATGAWLVARATTATPAYAGTVALAAMVGTQLGQTVAAGYRSPLVLSASAVSAAALTAIIQTPGVSHFFGCRPLGPLGWATVLTASAAGTGASVLASSALTAAARRRRRPAAAGAGLAELVHPAPAGRTLA